VFALTPCLRLRKNHRVLASPLCGRQSRGRDKLAVLLCYKADHVQKKSAAWQDYSTVTDFARFRGLSTSVPLIIATW